jgi:hypothetical protein
MTPLEFPLQRGFLLPPNGLRGSHHGAPEFEGWLYKSQNDPNRKQTKTTE